MNNLARGGRPVMRIVFAGCCVLLVLVGPGAFEAQSLGQSAPASPVGPRTGDSPPSRPARTGADDPRSRPLKLYRTHCIDCHDTDGRGLPVREIMTSIPDFTRPGWHQMRSNERLVHSIREGKGSMPAMKAKLGETEVVQLVSLVRNFQGARQFVPAEPEDEELSSKPTEPKTKTAIPTTFSPAHKSVSPPTNASVNHEAGAGSVVYQRSCVACHGAEGRGSALRALMPSIPDFASPVWQERRSDAQLMTTILEGKGTGMPTFRGKLDDAQTRNLVAYIRAFAPKSSSATIARPTEFKQRFQQLRQEMENLKRQYEELSTIKKP
jgi:mono/diheme cytochrome c family protein